VLKLLGNALITLPKNYFLQIFFKEGSMRIGIIVHSKSGHSLQVAKEIKDAMLHSGHQVDVLQVKALNDGETKVNLVRLTSLPDISPYQLIIFGAPVRGGRLSPVLQAYLAQLPDLQGKMLMGYVTQAFPFPSMGGYQAIRGLREICQLKHTDLLKSAVINWMVKSTRNKQIAEAITLFESD
jgi:NAD(P)H dehydrogenase (quinone)